MLIGAEKLQASKRYHSIDAMRGFFLLIMTTGHLSFVFNSYVGRATHHTIGFVDAAQGFVVFSGFVMGLQFARKGDALNIFETLKYVAARFRQVFFWQVILLLSVSWFCIVFTAEHFPGRELSTNGQFIAVVEAVLILSGPPFIDILPMYLYFFAFLPPALIALQRGHWALVLIVSVMVWAVAQHGGAEAFGGILERKLRSLGPDVDVGLYFNRMAWQLLFFGSLVLGFNYQRRRFSFDWIESRVCTYVFWVCMCWVFLFIFSQNLASVNGLSGEWHSVSAALFDRQPMAVGRIITFLAYCFIFFWIIKTSDQGWKLKSFAASALRGVLASKFLIMLGKNSLYVYAWHVALCYGASFFVAEINGWAGWTREILVALSALSLIIPTLLKRKM